MEACGAQGLGRGQQLRGRVEDAHRRANLRGTGLRHDKPSLARDVLAYLTLDHPGLISRTVLRVADRRGCGYHAPNAFRRDRRMLRRALLALSLLVLGAVPPPARAEIKFNQQPALFQALQSHDVEAVRSAIANGENVNGRDADGRSALIAAAIGRNAAIVRVLLDAGASVEETDSLGNTALSWAADAGDPAVVQALLDAGAKVDQDNRQGITPLMAAARNGRSEEHTSELQSLMRISYA